MRQAALSLCCAIAGFGGGDFYNQGSFGQGRLSQLMPNVILVYCRFIFRLIWQQPLKAW